MPGPLVCGGGVLACSFGLAPSTLNVLPRPALGGVMPAATVLDHLPIVNIAPFGMCTSPLNPTVAAATAAALGVPTPMPCIPNTPAPWLPGAPTVLVGPAPALDQTSTCLCAWGGVIQIAAPGQAAVLL